MEGGKVERGKGGRVEGKKVERWKVGKGGKVKGGKVVLYCTILSNCLRPPRHRAIRIPQRLSSNDFPGDINRICSRKKLKSLCE